MQSPVNCQIEIISKQTNVEEINQNWGPNSKGDPFKNSKQKCLTYKSLKMKT